MVKNATYKNGDLGDGLVYPHYWLKKPNRELLQYRSGSFVIHCFIDLHQLAHHALRIDPEKRVKLWANIPLKKKLK